MHFRGSSGAWNALGAHATCPCKVSGADMSDARTAAMVVGKILVFIYVVGPCRSRSKRTRELVDFVSCWRFHAQTTSQRNPAPSDNSPPLNDALNIRSRNYRDFWTISGLMSRLSD